MRVLQADELVSPLPLSHGKQMHCFTEASKQPQSLFCSSTHPPTHPPYPTHKTQVKKAEIRTLLQNIDKETAASIT